MQNSAVKNYISPLPGLALKTVNTCLLILIIMVNLYTIGVPLKMNIGFWLEQHFGSTSANLNNIVNSPSYSAAQVFTADKVEAGKRLVIPALLLDKQIYEGTSPYTVNRGVWRLPQTSTPDKGGNTVLVGHRFSYKDPAVFYNLDKMEVGQRFAVFWDNHKYLYEVSVKEVVPPNRIDIEAPTAEPQMTLYTCTPLWTAKNRLIVIGKLVGVS